MRIHYDIASILSTADSVHGLSMDVSFPVEELLEKASSNNNGAVSQEATEIVQHTNNCVLCYRALVEATGGFVERIGKHVSLVDENIATGYGG